MKDISKEIKVYNNVSSSPLSIARFSGGAKINGEVWKYDFANDALVRKADIKAYKAQIAEVDGAKEPKFTN